MRKLLLLPVLGLSALIVFAHPHSPESQLTSRAFKEKEDSSINPRTSGNQDRSLWLLTARITENRTLRKDTTISFKAENYVSKKEIHVNSTTVTRGEVVAVIENQAEDPASEFWFHTDIGEPVSITVSGSGTLSRSSSNEETINGKLIHATIGDFNVSGSPLPKASLMFYYTPDSKDVSVGINFKAKGSDKGRMFYNEWKDIGGDIDNYNLSCSGGCSVSDGSSCNITKTSTGYQASWRKAENKQRHTVDGTEFITSEITLEVIIKPYKPSDKPEVTLYGCSELGIEEQGEVIASGKPEGGKFRFWVEPGNLMKVEPDGESSAILTGSAPGKGLLYVEYTTPEGKTKKVSQPASCVKIENYNGGKEIPQIALYDINGKKLPGTLKVPVSAQPSNIEELVDFVPADKSVLTAVGLPGAVELTGLGVGKTTLKATTNCGNTIGPAVDVEVVNCDDETIARLEKQRQAAIENLQIATRELQKTAASKEFEKSRDDLVASTGDLLVKVGVTVIAGGKAPSAGVATAAQLANDAVGLSDMIASGSHEELFINGVKAAAGKIWGATAGTLVNLESVAEAADRFYKNISEIQLHEEAMKSAMESYEKAFKAFEDVVKRQQICKRDKTQPQKTEEPKPAPTTDPTKPTPPDQPRPKTETPPSKEQPTATDPGNEEPPISPPPPTSEPRQVGLPYSPEECGCEKQRSIGISANDISTIQSGTKNLGVCVDRFNKISVADYTKTLNEFSELTKSLETATSDKPELFLKKTQELKPQLDSLILRVKEYDKAGKAFLNEFEKCPESVKAGMDVLESAITVTVDSIKTRY